MSPLNASHCARCGAALPPGGGAHCPRCGEPADPGATWRPGISLLPPQAVEMPPRLPLGLLAFAAVVCALMGLALGLWLSGGRAVPARRVEASLPPRPPPGPPVSRPIPVPQYYPAPRPAPTRMALPPARVTPPPLGGGPGDRGTGRRGDWGSFPASVRAYVPSGGRPVTPSPRPPVPPSPRPPVAPDAPLRAAGMATVHVTNPSAAPIDVVLAGRGSQRGVVGPHAAVDFLIPPGRYDIALHGPARTQHFYDAPVDGGDVLSLIYMDRAPQRPE